MEEFLKVSRDLIGKEDATFKQLISELRSLSVEMSKDKPPIKVLYCASFGCFGFSKSYLSFFEQDEDAIYTNRIDNEIESKLKSFARFILDKYPQVDQILRIYYKYNISDICEIAMQHQLKKINTSMVTKNLEAVKSLIQDNYELPIDETKTITHVSMFFTTDCFKKYTKAQLIELQRKMTEYLTIEEMPQGLVSLAHNFYTECKEYRHHGSFDAFADSDLANLTPDMWFQQNHFVPFQMRFIHWCIQNKKYEFNVDDWSFENESHLVSIGLMLASGRHGKLDYVDVPFYSDWKITDYDGRETIMY